jgi:hypothetical protein
LLIKRPRTVLSTHAPSTTGPALGAVIQDAAVQGDRIAARGDLSRATGRQEVDASGLAVAPGFIDMLDHSESALIAGGLSQGMIRQGVTLLVFGDSSMGPLNARMKKYQIERQGDIKFDITWDTLGEFLDTLVSRGVSAQRGRASDAGSLAHGLPQSTVVPQMSGLSRWRRAISRPVSSRAAPNGSVPDRPACSENRVLEVRPNVPVGRPQSGQDPLQRHSVQIARYPPRGRSRVGRDLHTPPHFR